MDGIQKAKQCGVRFGPKKKLTPEQIIKLQQRRDQGTLIKTLMHDYGLSKASVYRSAQPLRLCQQERLTPY
jgi:DNA invertase Pin-like site-specific DNA recombinase